jgi:hypothetical protein
MPKLKAKKESENLPTAEEHREVDVPEEQEIKLKDAEAEAESEAEGEAEAEGDAEAGKPKLRYKDPDAEAEPEAEACPKCGAAIKEGTCVKCGYTVKGEMGGTNPEESETIGASDPHTITPNMTVPSKGQNVFVPTSRISVSREQPKYPNEVQLKSASPDLNKSPLFVELTKQINGIQKALATKLEAVEKSYNDRLANLQKTLDKFYAQPFYKSVNENVNPEAVLQQSIAKQIEKGSIEFRN